MKPHEEFFARQAEARAARGGGTESEVEQAVFIWFEAEAGAYAVPVADVREIVDAFVLSPYPEADGLAGEHLGIISLRGKVLPVIAPRLLGAVSPKALAGAKLLVVEFEPDAAFCLPVRRVRKVLVPLLSDHCAAGVGAPCVLNIQGRPVRVVRQADLLAVAEAAA